MAQHTRSESATGPPIGFQSGYLYSYALVMLLGLIGAASLGDLVGQVTGSHC